MFLAFLCLSKLCAVSLVTQTLCFSAVYNKNCSCSFLEPFRKMQPHLWSYETLSVREAFNWTNGGQKLGWWKETTFNFWKYRRNDSVPYSLPFLIFWALQHFTTTWGQRKQVGWFFSIMELEQQKLFMISSNSVKIHQCLYVFSVTTNIIWKIKLPSEDIWR